MVTVRDLQAGDAGWVLEQHAVHYTRVEGFGPEFEALVARILADFLSNRDAPIERGWIAERGGRRVGCVFCVRHDAEIAKLRMLLTTRCARGEGIGQILLDTLLAHARGAGFTQVRLWTHAEHEAACRLYASSGFTMVSSEPVHSYGRDLTEQIWEKHLRSNR